MNAPNEPLTGDRTDEVVPGVIAEILGIEISACKPEAMIVSDLGADSLDVVEIVMGLEDAFGIEIKPADERAVRTVGDAISLVNRKLHAIAIPPYGRLV